MASRQDARRVVLSALYSAEFGSGGLLDLDFGELAEQEDWAKGLLAGIRAQKRELDALLGTHLGEEGFSKLGLLELNVLRIGLFELRCTQTSKAVAISQAVVLAKTYCADSSHKLINAVLDALAQ